MTQVAPPVAARKLVRFTVHGIERVDDYAWLRDENWREVLKDPAKLAPDIRAHIDAENKYADAMMAPLAGLRARLVADMKGRIEQAQSDVPLPDGPFVYWKKFEPGAEHPLIVRSPRAGGPEQVLLDGPALAKGLGYFTFGQYTQSPDHRLYAYLVDETGAENFTLRIRDIKAGRDLPDTMINVSSFAWAPDNRTLFYVRRDDDQRPLLVYRHHLGTDPAADELIYEEKDPAFEVTVTLSPTKRFIHISSTSSDTTEERLIDAGQPMQAPMLVAARQPNLRYFVHDWGDRFVIRTNADGADDFKLMTAPADAPSRDNWRELVPGKLGRQVMSVMTFASHLVSLERHDGLPQLTIYRKSDGAAHAVTFKEEAYFLALYGSFEFDSRSVLFMYSSPATPEQVFEYDMESRERILRKTQVIPSGHDPSAYVVRRLIATTADNEHVPITVLHRRGLQLDGSAPLFLEGYGAYAYVFQTPFKSNVLSLVDRGFVYAIAHIRGGLDKGQRWYEGGRLQNKPNTFDDFVTAAEHLVKAGYTKTGRIVGRGDSAGGLLMGAVNNLRPDLFAGIVARVPFVDVLNTMLDETLPLTVSDYSEWGNPSRNIATYRRIAGYSPYDNVKAQAYPNMLVTAGISDPRVNYWEPAKWVAKLRATKTNDAKIALVTRMSAGHFGAAGRFEELDEAALIQAFAIDATGGARLHDAPVATAPPPDLIIRHRTAPAAPAAQR
jgi:oligopeptidase B